MSMRSCAKGLMFIAWSTVVTIRVSMAANLLVPSDFPTIQSAIDVAVNGDRVLVAQGVYDERIDFLGKSIEVLGEQGPEVTILNGGGSTGYVVSMVGCNPDQTVLGGFSVTGGMGSNVV